MSLISENPTQGLSQFFDNIWGTERDGFVYLPTLDRKNNEWRKLFFPWPAQRKAVIQHVLSGSAKGLDVYYSPVIYKGEGENKPGRPIKSNILGSNVIWVEFDGDSEDYRQLVRQNGDGDASEAGRRAHSPVPAPSVRVQSSNDGHEHVYWKLDDFITDVQWLEDKNRSITYSFRSDTSGWDATQVLRPPYTQNYKRDRPVTVIKDDGPVYPSSLFEPLVPPPQIVSENISIEELPTVESVIAKYPWDNEHFTMFMDPKIEEGKRSFALMRLGYFCIETGMTDTEAYAILFNADQRWGKYKGRADQKRRLVDIIDRARQKHPNPTAGLTFAGLLDTGQVEQTGRLLTYSFVDFLNSDVKVEWAVEDMLEINGLGMIAAMPGVGKTQVALQLGMKAALGQDFLKWKMPKQHKIAMLSLEMSHVAMKIFITTIAKGYTSEEHSVLNERFFIVPIGESIALDRPDGMKFLEAILDDIQPTGIIIDSIGKLSIDDLSEKTARVLNEKFAYIRNKYQAFMYFVHHNRKASDQNKKPVGLGDVYGNQYLVADMSSVIILWPHPTGVEVIPVKSRLAALKAPFIAARSEFLTFSPSADAQIDALVDRLNNDDSDSAGSADFSM